MGGVLAVTIATNGVHFTSFDGNGNISALVGATSGTATANYDYSPFGVMLRAEGVVAKANPIRWSTQFMDDVMGTAKYLFRDYQPRTGRWPNRDPFGEPGFELLQDGAPDVLGDGPNLYCFVENDPIGGYDFLGLKSRCDNDTDCMRCLLFHEGRGQNNKCLEALRNVIANRAKLNNRDICEEAKSGAYSGAKSSSGNYNKCCNQNWCADITKDKKGNPIKPYNPDKEDMSKIDDFIGSSGIGSSDGSVIRFHDTSISKPSSWGDEFVEVPVPGCDKFKFYKKVPKPPKTKKTPKK